MRLTISLVNGKSPGCVLLPPLVGRMWGIRISFNPSPGWIGGKAFAIPPQDIILNSTRINGAVAKLEDVASFGHEISHIEQGLGKFFSIQAEMLSAILTYRLEEEFGAPHVFPHYFEGEIVRIGRGTNSNPQPYSPWNEGDLDAFKRRLNLPYPLRPPAGDLPRDWLDKWGVMPFHTPPRPPQTPPGGGGRELPTDPLIY